MRFLILFLGLLLLSLRAYPQQMPEHALKASYLYNFALLTEWPAHPASTGQGEHFYICLFGQDPIATSLRSIDGKPIHQQVIKVARIGSLHAARKCHLIFIGEAESHRAPLLLNDLENYPILTVTDIHGITSSTLQLRIENERLVFDANLQRTKMNQIKLSSKLLQLAQIIR